MESPEKRHEEGHERPVSDKAFVHRIARHIAGHAASLHRLDGIIFLAVLVKIQY